jgi:hypothetical protein
MDVVLSTFHSICKHNGFFPPVNLPINGHKYYDKEAWESQRVRVSQMKKKTLSSESEKRYESVHKIFPQINFVTNCIKACNKPSSKVNLVKGKEIRKAYCRRFRTKVPIIFIFFKRNLLFEKKIFCWCFNILSL